MNANIFRKDHTCPWWLLATFDNPLRRWIHNPKQIVAELVEPGATVLDVGCGMGYFTLGLAELVGGRLGRVIAADLQPQMLSGLRRRAEKAKLFPRIKLHQSTPDEIGVSEPVDAALAFWMVHEVRQRQAFLSEIYTLLKPGGKFLVVEPLIHVSRKDYTHTLNLAEACGFRKRSWPVVRFSRAILLVK